MLSYPVSNHVMLSKFVRMSLLVDMRMNSQKEATPSEQAEGGRRELNGHVIDDYIQGSPAR
jgi:hypothetical protein